MSPSTVPPQSSLDSYLQDDGCDGEKLARSSKLDTVVHLLPVCEEASFALIWGLEGSPFDCVQ